MKVGDTVLVDIGFANGGYEAKILWLGKHFAKITADGDTWDLMRGRLTEKWSQERVQKAFDELGFEMPETEEQLKAFDEKFKDYPHKLTGKEIDPEEILKRL